MTDNQSPTRADFRRAAALIAHRANYNADGMRFVVEEASELNRTTPLLRCLIDGYRLITAELRTEQALAAIRQFVELCAQGEETGIRRAATAVLAHVDHNVDAFNAVLIEANEDDESAGVVASLMEMYATLMPELCTPHGLHALAQWTARIAGSEDQGGGSAS